MRPERRPSNMIGLKEKAPTAIGDDLRCATHIGGKHSLAHQRSLQNRHRQTLGVAGVYDDVRGADHPPSLFLGKVPKKEQNQLCDPEALGEHLKLRAAGTITDSARDRLHTANRSKHMQQIGCTLSMRSASPRT